MVQESNFLLEKGFAVHVMTPRFAGSDRLAESLPGDASYSYYFIPPFVQKWRFRHVNKILADLTEKRSIRSARPDLVHVFFTWTNQGVEPLWLCSRLGIPTVISVHNTFPVVPLGHWLNDVASEAFRAVKGIYGVSAGALGNFCEIFSKHIPEEARRDVIYNPVDTRRFSPSEGNRKIWRRRLGVPDDEFLIGSVGRLDKQKQPLLLLEVFHRMRQMLPNLRLAMVGDGALRGNVDQYIVDNNLSRSVHIEPFIKNPETFFPALDLHLLVSRNEGFGIVTAEAMSCGVPVAGTDVAGTNEVIDDAYSGLLLPTDDVEEMVECLRSLIEDRARLSRFALEGRRRVENCFSYQKWTQEIRDFYEAIEITI